MILLGLIIVICCLLYLAMEVNIDITKDAVIIWYTSLLSGKRTFQILYTRSDE